jgi:hypothetical protein
MLWIMLPIATALSGPVIDVVPVVVDVVLVEIVIVIDVDVAVAVPVTVAPIIPGRAPSHSTAEGQGRSRDVTRVSVGVIWIAGGGRSVDYCRIVGRNVDHFGISLLNDDHLFASFDRLRFYDLLRAGL